MQQITSYLLKEKINGKYICRAQLVVGDSLTEICLMIKLSIRKTQSSFHGSIFFYDGWFYVTDRFGKAIVKTKQNLYKLILTI